MSHDFAERTHRRLLVFVALLAAATMIGLIVLWPSAGDLPDIPALDPLYRATIEAVEPYQSEPDPLAGQFGQSALVTVAVHEGPEAGQTLEIDMDLAGLPALAPGDVVMLARFDGADVGGAPFYSIADFERTGSLWLLAALFVGVVVAVGRWHGVRSLLGLVVSLAVIVKFVVPAILAGQSPAAVALVGAMAVMIVTLYLGHGVNHKTTAAVIGTAAALAVTAGMGLFFIGRTGLTGFVTEEAQSVRFLIEGIDLSGLVLAGLIIGALGVLDDVTVSQASTVYALHDTDRTLSGVELMRRAMRVGRDHIASTVNTLFLAYAGASLMLLILFSTSGAGAGEIINSEAFAEELVKTLVGSIGLIAAVPLTTALAATLAVRRPFDPTAAAPTPPSAPDAHHGH